MKIKFWGYWFDSYSDLHLEGVFNVLSSILRSILFFSFSPGEFFGWRQPFWEYFREMKCFEMIVFLILLFALFVSFEILLSVIFVYLGLPVYQRMHIIAEQC